MSIYHIIIIDFALSHALNSPFEHGEVFVLDDGGEVDLDLVCYFFSQTCSTSFSQLYSFKLFVSFRYFIFLLYHRETMSGFLI